MHEYRSFIFQSYRLDRQTRSIELCYSLDSALTFSETIQLPEGEWTTTFSEEALEKALFNLHLIGGISYYKAFCPPEIILKSGTLSQNQAQFWNTVYQKGLGQFLFNNKLDFAQIAPFPFSQKEQLPPRGLAASKSLAEARLLVPIGGGKDSLVTIELLKKASIGMRLLRVGSHPIIRQLAKTAEVPLLSVERALDPKLFALNAEGAYNGHVPVTAYIAWLSVVVGILYGYDGVVMSNERSSSYGNVEYLGREINHQWSKSREFEALFQDYLLQSVTADFQYLNILRPCSELQISQLFTRYPQYFREFTSCNKNWQILGKGEKSWPWCGRCPKCAFVFLILAPYLPLNSMMEIFGRNLLDEETLLPFYRQLVGLEGFKPFECVGTPEESQAAFFLLSNQPEYSKSAAVQMLNKESLVPQTEALLQRVLTAECDYPVSPLNRDLLSTTGVCVLKN